MNMYLKPCPCCGSEAQLYVGDGIKVICRKCGIQTKVYCDYYPLSYTEKIENNATINAIEAWNRRVEDCKNDEN